jgi:hypothetical protein
MEAKMTVEITNETAGKKTDEAEGIIIRLFRKLTPNKSDARIDKLQYVVWSGFDAMNIESVQSMEQFYNFDGDENFEKNGSDFRKIFEEQRMCLYRFNNEEKDSKENNDDDFLKPDYIKDGEQMPLITLAEIKLDDDYLKLKKLDDCVENIRDILHDLKRKLVEKIGVKAAYEFRIYRSLGYSDFVIIFRSATFIYSSYAIDQLGNTRYQNGNKQDGSYSFIWSSYTLLGIAREQRCWDCWDDNNFSSVHIRMTIKPGVVIKNIINRIDKTINGNTDMDNKGQKGYSIEGGFIFGKYDVEIIIKPKNQKAGAKRIIELFVEKEQGIWPVLHPFSEKYITQTNTNWIFDSSFTKKLPIVKNEKLLQNLKPLYLEHSKPIFNDFIENYNKMRERLPDSLRRPLKELLNCYERLMRDHSTKPLLFGLHDVFSTFFEVLEDYFDENLKENEQEQEEMLKSLKEFIRMLAELINDRVQASRPLFETPAYNLKFIGSITKINMAYSSLINDVVGGIEKYIGGKLEKTGRYLNSKLTIFLTLQLSDKIESNLLFKNSSLKPKKNLIYISSDITSFFNPEMAVKLLLHEIGHYIRPVDRSERNIVYLEMICRYVAIAITYNQLKIGGSSAINKDMPIVGSIVGYIEKMLFTVVWSYMKENSKDSLRLGTFMEEMFPNISNALLFKRNGPMGKDDNESYNAWLKDISKSKGKNFESHTVKEDMDYNTFYNEPWIEMLDNIYIEVSESWDSILEENKITMARHLAQCRLNEDTQENRKDFVKGIIKYFDTREFEDKVDEATINIKNIFIEVVADTFMSILLKLGEKEYNELIDVYYNSISIGEVSSNGNAKLKKDSLEIRSEIVSRLLSRINRPSKNDMEGMCDTKFPHYYEVYGLYKLVKYIATIYDLYQDLIAGKEGLMEIHNLIKEYKKLEIDSGNRLGRQMRFIEEYWQKSLKGLVG